MQLVTFTLDGRTRPGVLQGDTVLDLGDRVPVGPEGDLLELARRGDAALAEIRTMIAAWSGPRHPLGSVRLRAPILSPPKVIGIGLNYIDHCKEANLKEPKEPVLFCKFSTCVADPDQDIVFDPGLCVQIDYEVELGFVIGKTARNIGVDRALDHVLGYTIVNDVTARDLQFRDGGQWDLSKSLDTFCPWGPSIVTRDEIPDPQKLGLRLRLNGAEMQRSNTSNMIFGVAQLIAFISRGVTLLPGDLVTTGTPFGVGFTRKPPVYLEDGDECVLEIDRLGTLTNRVRARK